MGKLVVLKREMNIAFITIALIFILIEPGYSCTTFFMHHNGESVFGKNYDWVLERGAIILNEKGLSNGKARHAFLVADKDGNCTVIEFFDGKLIIHDKDALPIKALTNSIYSDALEYLKAYESFGGKNAIVKGEGPMHRFTVTAKMLKDFKYNSKNNMVDYAFEILSVVEQKMSAQWNIVHDMTRLKVYFATKKYPRTKTINLARFDLQGSTPTHIIELRVIIRAFYPASNACEQ